MTLTDRATPPFPVKTGVIRILFFHIVSSENLPSEQFGLLSVFAQPLLTTSVFDSIVEDINKSILSKSYGHTLEPFWRISFRTSYRSLNGMKGSFGFSRPDRKENDTSAVKPSGSPLTGLLR